ncbi:MAG: hypothetical protein LBK59_10770 [Bifidobacteriaceae bacterium]|jgi:ABC-type transport system involved in multi-copper enzyme maturation permease subunit|nr:hypothetical protein [Bifidobacteriaceae bacterium]
MKDALLVEYRKVTTTRSWWLLLAGLAGYTALLALLVAWALGQGGTTMASDQVAGSIYTLGASMGYAFPLAVGALAVTGEFRHRTIMPTLLAEPRKGRIMAAKAFVSLAMGLVYGLVGTVVCASTGAAMVAARGEPTHLTEPGTLRVLGASVVLLAVWAVLGTALGTLMTNQSVVIVAILAFTQFVEPLARMVLGGHSFGGHVVKLLPGAAGEALVGTSFVSLSTSAPLLEPGWGLAVLLAYGALFAIGGRFIIWRRDVA